MQHSNRRRIQIVKLPAPRTDDEGDNRHEHHQRGERHDNEDHAHDARSFGNVVLDHDANTTVNELAGIRIAATSGLIVPVTASAAPTML